MRKIIPFYISNKVYLCSHGLEVEKKNSNHIVTKG